MPIRPLPLSNAAIEPADKPAAKALAKKPARSKIALTEGTEGATPAATAVAATVNACVQRSASSAPAVTFTTRERAMAATVTVADTIGPVSALEIFYTSLLVATAVVVSWFAVFVVYRLFRGQR